MREIKYLGVIKKLNVSQAYPYAIFECLECKKHIEKIRRDGRKAKYCSHKCYAKNRRRRGAYRPSVIISSYRYILMTEHPFSSKKGYVAEHRLVMEELLGRYLSSSEVVHHIDGDKLNNSPINLEVMSNSQHISFHKRKRGCNEKLAI